MEPVGIGNGTPRMPNNRSEPEIKSMGKIDDRVEMRVTRTGGIWC